MNLDTAQKQTLGQNIKGYATATGRSLSSFSNDGISWNTAQKLADGKVGKYITSGLIKRIEKLLGHPFSLIISEKIEFKKGGVPKANGKTPHRLARAAAEPLVHKGNGSMFVIEYGDGTEVAVPSGMKITVTGPRSIRVG